MATNVDDDEQIKREFCSLNTFFKEIKQSYFSDSEYFKEISMGMSHDYPLAVEAGSTLVLSLIHIFGYQKQIIVCGKIGLIDAGYSKTTCTHIVLYIIGIDFITQFQM